MRAPSLILLALLPAAAAWAQVPAVEPAKPLDPRQNQKIERIRIEDKSNRIDELRVGGQTQSIKVQPKGSAPAYEMPATDLAHSRPEDAGEKSGIRQRLWNIFSF